MQDQSDVRGARAIFWLAALVALLAPASVAHAQQHAGPEATAGLSPRLLADASWHGRPIQRPWPTRSIAVRTETSGAASLRRGTGFSRPGGSDRVRRLQRQLRKLGYRPGRSDGLFGPRTQAAVIAFQRKHGLPQTGVAGTVTQRTLRSRAAGGSIGSTRRSAARSQPNARPAAPAPPVSAHDDPSVTPLVAALSITAVAALLALFGLLGRRRMEWRRAAAMAPAAPRLNGARGRAIGYAAGLPAWLQRQEKEIEACCDRRHLELVEMVSDVMDGGVAARDRPGLRHALSLISSGDASTLVVSEFDRLGANDEEIRRVLRSVSRRHGTVIALGSPSEWRCDDPGRLANRASAGDVVETSSKGGIMGTVQQSLPDAVDAGRWDDVVHRYAPYVNAVLVRAYRVPDEIAEDIFDEVFRRTWVALHELGDDRAVRSWMTRLTHELVAERDAPARR